METGKTQPDYIVVGMGIERLSASQLALINTMKAENPNLIVVSSPEEIRQLAIDKLKELKEQPKANPFEPPPIYITNPYKDMEMFTPPKTRQQRRAEERKNKKK